MVAGVRRSDSAGHTFCCRLAKAMVMHEHGPGLQNGCLEHGRSGRSSIRVSRAVSATWSGKVLEVSALRVAPARQGIAGRSGARASRRGPGRGPDHRAAIPAHSTLRDSRTLRATWLSRSVGTARVDLRTCRSSERNAGSGQVWALSPVPACRIFGVALAKPGMRRFRRFRRYRASVVAVWSRHFAVRARQSPITGEYSRSGNCAKYRSPTLWGSRLSMSS